MAGFVHLPEHGINVERVLCYACSPGGKIRLYFSKDLYIDMDGEPAAAMLSALGRPGGVPAIEESTTPLLFV